DAIIGRALRAEPGAALRAVLRNGWVQIGWFETGDGLRPCPDTVAPWIDRNFPVREQVAYAASRQSQGRLAVPAWLQALHRVTAIAGVAGCGLVLAMGRCRRHVAAGFAAAVLL